VCNEAFQTDKANFKHSGSLYNYFELYYTMYKSKNPAISLENLIEKYKAVDEKFAFERARSMKIKNDSKEQKKIVWATKNITRIDTYSKNMELLIEKEATCETLIPMYKKNFEATKNNAAWLRKAVGKLDAKGCKDDALFIKLAEAIDVLEPTANSKMYLSKIHERKGNSAKAEEYLRQYFAMETNGIKKASVLSKEGRKAANNGQKSKARNYYLEALKTNPSSGRTYLNLAKLYGSSANECGTDEFSKKAVYWKAAEMARKAAKIDASVKREATKWIERYMSLAPNKTAIFNKTYKGGEKIAMKCWVGGTVIVPKL
jgi:tetratricopeptide (TPR) repeat protein